ncbi:MAG: ABC transporter ATP-binding protein [Caldilineaceae bacterium]
MNARTKPQTLLEIEDLHIWYSTSQGESKAVNGLDLKVNCGEIFGLAGESGCGKSTLIQGILRLTKLPGHIQSGKITLYLGARGGNGDIVDLLSLNAAEMRQLRWKHISYIPQSAMNVLNPVARIETQMMDALNAHIKLSKNEARELIGERLEMVGLSKGVARMYPHELSGGMKQRVTIAAAITMNPDLLIADEPTTALDVNVQRVILQELEDVRNELGLTILYVTHDMAVHAQIADRIGIMYAGLIVEVGTATDVLKNPLHPYSNALASATPKVGGERKRLQSLQGVVPSPLAWPTGCAFHPRCSQVMDICREQKPELRECAPGRSVACHLYT